MTGDGYLRAWQTVRVLQLHRAASRRLQIAASAWVDALAAFTVIDEDRALLATRAVAEQPPGEDL